MQLSGALVAVVLAGSLVSSRSAEACHIGTELGIVLFGIAEVGINAPLTVHDAIISESSLPYGITETAVTAPGVLIGALLARHTYTTCEEGGQDYPVATRGERMFTFGMLGWSAALLAHGIYTIARDRSVTVTVSTPPPVIVVPITSEDGEMLGFGVGGRF